MALQFEARKIAMKQDRTGFVLTISIHPDELPVELMRDFVGTRYACAVVRIQDDETATEYNNRVKRAGMLCKNKDFWAFLGASLDLGVDSEDEAATELCKRCGITSRTELHGNAKAQALFDSLIKDFEEEANDF